jgi:hypothetical protein
MFNAKINNYEKFMLVFAVTMMVIATTDAITINL